MDESPRGDRQAPAGVTAFKDPSSAEAPAEEACRSGQQARFVALLCLLNHVGTVGWHCAVTRGWTGGKRLSLTFDNRLLYCVDVARGRHPSRIVEEAVRYAESSGWTYKTAGKSAHAWGFRLCPGPCPQFAVWATPQVPEHHARAIGRAVDRCPHSEGESE